MSAEASVRQKNGRTRHLLDRLRLVLLDCLSRIAEVPGGGKEKRDRCSGMNKKKEKWAGKTPTMNGAGCIWCSRLPLQETAAKRSWRPSPPEFAISSRAPALESLWLFRVSKPQIALAPMGMDHKRVAGNPCSLPVPPTPRGTGDRLSASGRLYHKGTGHQPWTKAPDTSRGVPQRHRTPAVHRR